MHQSGDRSHKKRDRLERRKGSCATQGEKAAIVKELRESGYQLKHLLKAIGLSRSTYYYEISKEDAIAKRNEETVCMIREIFEQNKGRYGVRRVYHELINRGVKANHKKVQRLMHCMGLKGKRPKEKYHSYQGEVGKVADNIVNRDFSTTKPLEKWTTDVSQFSFPWGKCYLSPILDMHTNEVISYDLSQSPNMEQIRRMLEKGLGRFASLNGLIIHSDQGWQYQHAYFRNAIKERGIIQSMSRKGNCYDNSIMETFFGRLKNEMFYGCEKDYRSYEEFSAAIADYIDYYNNQRIQAKTKWMPPVKYRIASTC
ncbi:MAG: IS3 family transposase [Lachnospiraceae bacterium]|nr:IS3 family transposase [Lachnospiraceae bacterium]MBQ9592309.1 IS3 family transposase [Lachnospiraceae bacterium]